MRTKFRKQATTYLLDIPELLAVVEEWEAELRECLTQNNYWFAPISPNTGEIDPTVTSVGRHRAKKAREDIHRWAAEVALPYHSPHQFRHGHAVYALKQAQDVADLKAVSMNLMHSNLSITDGVYGILSEQDVHKRISTLGINAPSHGTMSTTELRAVLEQILAEMHMQSSR